MKNKIKKSNKLKNKIKNYESPNSDQIDIGSSSLDSDSLTECISNNISINNNTEENKDVIPTLSDTYVTLDLSSTTAAPGAFGLNTAATSPLVFNSNNTLQYHMATNTWINGAVKTVDNEEIKDLLENMRCFIKKDLDKWTISCISNRSKSGTYAEISVSIILKEFLTPDDCTNQTSFWGSYSTPPLKELAEPYFKFSFSIKNDFNNLDHIADILNHEKKSPSEKGFDEYFSTITSNLFEIFTKVKSRLIMEKVSI